jgi:hypothetical protein
MQGGWQPPPGGGGYGPPGGGGGGYGPPGAGPPGYGGPPPGQQGFTQNPYAGPAQNMMQIAPSYGSYEFNDYENSVIDKTASRMKLWGIISTVIGGLQIVESCGMFWSAQYATNLPIGIVAIVVGVTFIGAGNSLKAVVTTQGNDLMHMMQAMQKMSSAFIIEIICAIVGFVLAIIGALIVGFIAVAVAASQ